MSESLDCLVIGGGPAGLTAAIYLSRFRRRVRVVDKGWSRAEWITLSHNLPGFAEGLAGPALLDALRSQARRYGARLHNGEIASLQRAATGGFSATLDGESLSMKTVLLATGVVEIKPPLPHVAEAVKRGRIRTCPICDGFEAIGKRVAVLGAGDHAAAEAIFLRTFTDQVTLLLPADSPDALPGSRRRSLRSAGVSLSHVTVGAVGIEEEGVVALTVEDGFIHRFDLVYAAFGTTAQSQLAIGLSARADDTGRLWVSDHQQTSVRGLYAAGDVVRGLNQICVAEGEAAVAATAIHNHLPTAFA